MFYISTAFLSVDHTAPACMQSRIQTRTCEYILNIAFKSLLLHLPPDTSYLHRRRFYRRTSQSVLMKNPHEIQLPPDASLRTLRARMH